MSQHYNQRKSKTIRMSMHLVIIVSEDKVRGHKIRPDSINHYLYCYNRPLRLLDLDGRDPLDETDLEAMGYYTPNDTNYSGNESI